MVFYATRWAFNELSLCALGFLASCGFFLPSAIFKGFFVDVPSASGLGLSAAFMPVLFSRRSGFEQLGTVAASTYPASTLTRGY